MSDEAEDFYWRAPTGAFIFNTVEVIPGTCGIVVDTDASDDYKYDGSGTVVDWNRQEPVTLAGETVFQDEDGGEWLESQLIKDPNADLPETITSPWDDVSMVEKLVAQKIDEVSTILMADRKSGDIAPGQEAALGECRELIAEILHKVRMQNA